jgi:hypothetical protein
MDNVLDALTLTGIKAHSTEYAAGFWAALFVFFILIVIIGKRARKKGKPVNQDLMKELEYAEYLKWALENGYVPHFNK